VACPRSVFTTFKPEEIAQPMSDTLQLVVYVRNNSSLPEVATELLSPPFVAA